MSICPHCGKEFEPKKSQQKFCCKEHRWRYNAKKQYLKTRGESLPTPKAVGMTQIEKKICDLRLSGMTYKQILDAVGFYSCASSIRGVCERYGVTDTYKKDEQRKVCVLRLQGYSRKLISEKLGINKTKVERIIKDSGLDFPQVTVFRKSDYHNQHFKATEEERKQYVESLLPDGFSYIGGYIDCDHKVTIKCKTCGSVFERSMVAIRKGAETRCENCSRIKRKQKAKAVELERAAKAEERKKRLEQKESERLTDLFLRTRLVECKECGKVFSTTSSIKVCCSAECSRKYANRKCSQRKDRRISKDKRIDRGITAMSLYKRDNGVCWICGGQCDPNDKQSRNGTIICGDMYPSVDHIIPVCDGGEDSWENVRLAHRICNTRRFQQERRSPLSEKNDGILGQRCMGSRNTPFSHYLR